MTDKQLQEIGANFPANFEHANLGTSVSLSEFALFKRGIFAGSMDEKWNIFVLNTTLYFSRSWTGYCIFKINFEEADGLVLLKDFYVNRDSSQYNSTNIERDAVLLKKTLQSYLNRDDLYSDPKLQLPIIQQVIHSGNYQDHLKTIGSDNTGNTRHTYQILTSPPNTDFFDIVGWPDLKKNIADKPDDEQLITLRVQHKTNNSGKTFYFDKDAQVLLGEIITKRKANNFLDALL